MVSRPCFLAKSRAPSNFSEFRIFFQNVSKIAIEILGQDMVKKRIKKESSAARG